MKRKKLWWEVKFSDWCKHPGIKKDLKRIKNLLKEKLTKEDFENIISCLR